MPGGGTRGREDHARGREAFGELGGSRGGFDRNGEIGCEVVAGEGGKRGVGGEEDGGVGVRKVSGGNVGEVWSDDERGRVLQGAGPRGGQPMGRVVGEIFQHVFLPDEAGFLAGDAVVVVLREGGVKFVEGAAVGGGVLRENGVAHEDRREVAGIAVEELFDRGPGGGVIDERGFDGVAREDGAGALDVVAIGEPEKVAKRLESGAVEGEGVANEHAGGGAGRGFFEQKPGHGN